MILIDTPVWIRALSGKHPHARQLAKVLLGGTALAHELVYGELLIGDNGGRAKMLADYATLTFSPSIPHREVAELVRARRLSGRGLSWIDTHLLASAMVGRALLYTADAALIEAAAECGVLYRAE